MGGYKRKKLMYQDKVCGGGQCSTSAVKWHGIDRLRHITRLGGARHQPHHSVLFNCQFHSLLF